VDATMKMKCQHSVLNTSLACAMTITSSSAQTQAVEFQREDRYDGEKQAEVDRMYFQA
jgi:ethanolamine utilization protein EutP (predicted NTPase)